MENTGIRSVSEYGIRNKGLWHGCVGADMLVLDENPPPVHIESEGSCRSVSSDIYVPQSSENTAQTKSSSGAKSVSESCGSKNSVHYNCVIL